MKPSLACQMVLAGWVFSAACESPAPVKQPAPTTSSVPSVPVRFVDEDGDGWGTDVVSTDGEGALREGDCDDQSPEVYPEAPERCGEADLDCDGVPGWVDEDSEDQELLHDDVDGDGFGSGAASWSCPGSGRVSNDQDCDDADGAVHPDAKERCGGGDEDCDGLYDVDDPSLSDAEWGPVDGDGDGWGAGSGPTCGAVPPDGDCDDSDSDVFPGAVELCGETDRDCNGIVGSDDLDAADRVLGFIDLDGDGSGSEPGSFCPSDAFVSFGDDCDDLDAEVHPHMPESCNERDDNCNGEIDEGLPVVSRYLDVDGDGFGLEASKGCLGGGYVDQAGDCDDSEASVFPGATETCNDRDDDCDGHPDLPNDSGDLDLLGCDRCPDVDEFVVVNRHTVNPCLLDPPSSHLCLDDDTHDFGKRLHKIYSRPDLPSARSDLVVFFPPSDGTRVDGLPGAFAAMGYHVISMVRTNIKELYLGDCYHTDPALCLGILQEILDGSDASDEVEVPVEVSIETELQAVIAYLDGEEPGGGWGDHLDASGEVDWSGIHLLSWSSGGDRLGIVARERSVLSATALASPLDPLVFGGSDWATQAPALKVLTHTHEVADFYDAWTDLGTFTGLDLDPYVDLDAGWPWDTNASMLVTDVPIEGYKCSAHNVIAIDECFAESLTPIYRHLACSVAK